MYKIVITLFIVLTIFANAQDATSFIKEKKEIVELKKELNTFYNNKESEYTKRKKELDAILAKVQKEKQSIQNLHDKNKAILDDITGAISSKTTKIYNGMKPKIAADIFNRMVEDGRIEEVFDIILKLKEKKVTLIMKFLNIENASLITHMLEKYKVNNS